MPEAYQKKKNVSLQLSHMRIRGYKSFDDRTRRTWQKVAEALGRW